MSSDDSSAAAAPRRAGVAAAAAAVVAELPAAAAVRERFAEGCSAGAAAAAAARPRRTPRLPLEALSPASMWEAAAAAEAASLGCCRRVVASSGEGIAGEEGDRDCGVARAASSGVAGVASRARSGLNCTAPLGVRPRRERTKVGEGDSANWAALAACSRAAWLTCGTRRGRTGAWATNRQVWSGDWR